MKALFFKSAVFLYLFLVSCPVFSAEHVVQRDETLYSISRKYNTSVDLICKTNSISNSSVLKEGQRLEIPSSITHVVKMDETLYSISRQYHTSVELIYKANGFSEKTVLFAGQKVIIPENNGKSTQHTTIEKNTEQTNTKQNSSIQKDEQISQEKNTQVYSTYTVKEGDTFYRIALNNKTSVEELKVANNLSAKSVLKTGQILRIPGIQEKKDVPQQSENAEEEEKQSLPDLSANDPRRYIQKKGDSSLSWPVKTNSVIYMDGKVSGVQLSAERNEDVTTIKSGKVMFVGNYRGYGQVVFVQAKTGHIYVYSGLSSIKVAMGESVNFGTVIGTAGTDSIKGTSQICLMVYQKSMAIDPATAPRG